jgi:hypothetical protein
MTTANLESDIANGEKPREFLGQSVGFENELIGQTNFPLPARVSRCELFFSYRLAPEGLPSKPSETRRLRAGICRHRAPIGKAESLGNPPRGRGALAVSRRLLNGLPARAHLSSQGRTEPRGKSSLTVSAPARALS